METIHLKHKNPIKHKLTKNDLIRALQLKNIVKCILQTFL